MKWLRAQIKKRARQDTDAWVAGELEKLEAIEEAAWTEKDFSTLLKCMKRRADLLGLDAPTKIAPTTPDGNDEYTGLTDTERLERLAAVDLLNEASATIDGHAGRLKVAVDDGGGTYFVMDTVGCSSFREPERALYVIPHLKNDHLNL